MIMVEVFSPVKCCCHVLQIVRIFTILFSSYSDFHSTSYVWGLHNTGGVDIYCDCLLVLGRSKSDMN